MALNYIWVGFFLVAMVVALFESIFYHDYAVYERIVSSTFEMAEFAVMKIALPLSGVMILWLGLMNIGERAGVVKALSKVIRPFFSKLFPEIPKDHPANGLLVMNFAANMLGLDNAATPIGLKAMESLQDCNAKKDVASNAQIMFLALNTSGLTIIPVTILAQRAIMGASNPTDIFVPLLISTFFSTVTAILYVGIRQKLNIWNFVVIGWILALALLITGVVFLFSQLSSQTAFGLSKVGGNFLLFLVIMVFVGIGAWKRIDVYEAFIDGAKKGFATSIKILPYLVGMLVGIGVFRASGAMDLICHGLTSFFDIFLNDTRFVDALPTALMKPLSGSGAKAMMVETMKVYGADSFVGRLTCLFQGSADTTFYIIAMYFGSVGIKKTRYAVTAGLVADLGGVVAAIIVAYWFFG
ncbi:MAG: hypothetical protein J6T67_01655 [Paludibacteraceae bacterium]|nr:hypothetical protein [Paludibacteraceae bacterium]MBR4713156.1 hypothetical protein [Paludibacteraceae bacterium]